MSDSRQDAACKRRNIMEGTLDYRWQKNGMALGGIGAGSVEICQNGELREWDICNMGKWGKPGCAETEKAI